MKHPQHKGFMALSTVLILSAILVSIVIGVSIRSISRAMVSLDEEASKRAQVLSESCAEYALIELERTFEYAGDQSIMIGTDSCTIEPIEGSGNTNRTVYTESTVSGHISRIRVVVSEISPELIITSWERGTSF